MNVREASDRHSPAWLPTVGRLAKGVAGRRTTSNARLLTCVFVVSIASCSKHPATKASPNETSVTPAPTLCVSLAAAAAPQPRTIAVAPIGTPPAQTPRSLSFQSEPAIEERIANDSFTLAVLPDTQFYTEKRPGFFLAQTAFIASHAVSLNIKYVLHLGDLVQSNTARQWHWASLAMRQLDGKVPYAFTPGNHDYGPGGSAKTRETLLNQYFSPSRLSRWKSFGGAYKPGRLDNTYHLFSAGGKDYIIVALEWGPRDAVIAWANQVMQQHPQHHGILLTHAYLNNNNRRYDINDKAHSQRFTPHHYGTAGGVNDGEALWQKLVRHHNFVMTLNGHVLGDGTGYLLSVTDIGTRCHQMLSNFQMRPLGGEGYLRFLEFTKDGSKVKVHTYSPVFDSYLDAADQQFEFEL